MDTPLAIAVVAWLAGVAAFVGGLLAHALDGAASRARREAMHCVMAFGGGVLLAAVAFALAPPAMALLNPTALLGCVLLGGVATAGLDHWLSRHSGPRAQLMAMLSDFVPEAISLGAVFGHDTRLGLLLALFIGVQNLPEGFNAYRELAPTGKSARAALGTLLALSLLGPLAALAGHHWLQDAPGSTAALMAFAAGGILYLVFQDIAPKATMRRHWTPPLGAVLGFALGMLGAQALG